MSNPPTTLMGPPQSPRARWCPCACGASETMVMRLSWGGLPFPNGDPGPAQPLPRSPAHVIFARVPSGFTNGSRFTVRSHRFVKQARTSQRTVGWQLERSTTRINRGAGPLRQQHRAAEDARLRTQGERPGSLLAIVKLESGSALVLRLGPNAFGEHLQPGRVSDCYLGIP